jgi:hypothetical protein
MGIFLLCYVVICFLERYPLIALTLAGFVVWALLR